MNQYRVYYIANNYSPRIPRHDGKAIVYAKNAESIPNVFAQQHGGGYTITGWYQIDKRQTHWH